MASTRLSKTGSVTANSGYVNKFTWSGWVKRSGADIGTESGLFASNRDDGWVNSRFKLYFRDTDKLGWECKCAVKYDKWRAVESKCQARKKLTTFSRDIFGCFCNMCCFTVHTHRTKSNNNYRQKT